ncbi:MAG TPA: hypothetical protein VFR84_16100 [Candidatus Angelobacter sp.]|nr:hypothetical protein [Candidatus Angelobacter sp.]
MGAALFIVLQKEVQGVDASSVGGKFLARNLEMLDALAAKLRVRAFGEFISVNPEEAADFAEGEGVNASGLSFPAEQWFDPEDGLLTVRTLLNYVSSASPGDSRLLQDLTDCERVLTSAQLAGTKFHLAVDF